MLRLFVYFCIAFCIAFCVAHYSPAATSSDSTATTAPPREQVEPPELILANVYEQQVDLQGYWVSEKLDGVRAYWDGDHFISRQGNPYHAPDWFTDSFPERPLDGELWMGRGTFAELSGAVRRQIPDDSQWQRIRFMVFDLPDSPAPFDRRLNILRSLVAAHSSPYLCLVEQFRVSSRKALEARLNAVVTGGGEGLMLHRGDSLYNGGRSDDLLKVKTYLDAEAVVLAHIPGKGKFTGMMGSMVVETADGLRFRLGTGFSDVERANPPPVGSRVTFKYYGKTRRGVPRFASFLRIRPVE
jgi:DNA ligase-1